MIKKIFLLTLLLCSPVLGQWQDGLKPMLGQQIDYLKSNGIVGLWWMNEGGGNVVHDLSGNGNDGIKTGSPVWSTGKYGSVVDHAAADAGWNCGNNNSLNFTTSDFTVIADLSGVAGQTAFGSIVCRGLYDTDGWNLGVYEGANIDELYFQTWQGSAHQSTISSGNILEVGVSHIYALRRKGTSGQIFRDGTEVAYHTKNAHQNPLTSSRDFMIGRSNEASYDFDGKIGFIYIYNRALSDSEIAELSSNLFGMAQPVFPVWWYGGIGGEPPATSIPIFMYHYLNH